MTVVHILEHLPTESQLARKEADRERQQRNRAHRRGDHSLCVPGGHCDVANGEPPVVTRDVTANVTRDVGTGQDGTGQDGPRRGEGAQRESPGAAYALGDAYNWKGEVNPDDAEFDPS